MIIDQAVSPSLHLNAGSAHMLSGAGPHLLRLVVIGYACVSKLPRVDGIACDLLDSILIWVGN